MGDLQIIISTIVDEAKSRINISNALKKLEETPFLLKVIATLNKSASKARLQQDIKELENGNLNVKITPKLDKSQLNKDIQNIKSTPVDIKGNVDSKAINKDLTGASTVDAKIGVDEKYFKNRFDSLWQSVVKRFSMMSVLFGGVRLAKSSLADSLEVDRSLTNLLKVADELEGRDALPRYFQRANEIAKTLNVSTNSLIQSITEFKKQNFTLKEAEGLATIATMLGNVADMNVDVATQSLVSALKAFDTIGSLGENQYEERALAIADVINKIGNEFSISSEGIAVALQNASAALETAGNDIFQTVALIGAGNKILQDPSELGNALKTVSMRLRNTKGQLQELGYESDGAAESITKLQTQLLNLSGGKVNILSDNNTFKSTYDILLEIGRIYDQLTDVEQASILELIAGKQRGNAVAAILKNVEELPQIYEAALNSSGSAMAEFEKYQQSAEAALISFKESWVGIWIDIFSGEEIKNLANFGTSVLNLADKLNLLKTALIGVSVYGGAKLFIGTINGIQNTIASLNSLANAMSIIKAGNIAGSDISQLAALTKGLSDNQLRLVLSSKLLTQEQRVQILTAQGLTAAEAQLRMAQLGLAEANVAATATTATLSSTLKGLWATILANPLMWLAIAVTAVTSAISFFNNKQEESRKKAEESIKSTNEQIKSLDGLKTQYEQIIDSAKDETEKTKDLDAWKKTLVDTYKLEKDAIEGVNLEREKSLDLLDKEIWAAKKKAVEEGIVGMGDEYDKAKTAFENPKVIKGGLGTEFSEVTGVSQNVINRLKEYNIEIEKADTSTGLLTYSYLVNADSLTKQKEALAGAYTALKDKQDKTEAEITLMGFLKAEYDAATKTYDKYVDSYTGGTKLIAEKTLVDAFYDGKLAAVDSAEAYNNLSDELMALAGSSEILKNAIIDELAAQFPQFSGAVDEAADSLDSFGNAEKQAEADIEEFSKAMQTAIKNAQELTTALEAMSESGEIDSDSLNKIIAIYPEAIAYAHDFGEMQDFIAEKIRECEDEAIRSYGNIVMNNDSMVRAIIAKSSTLPSALASCYSDDYANFARFSNDKYAIEAANVFKLSELWSKYASRSLASIQGQISSLGRAGMQGHLSVEGQQTLNELMAFEEAYKAMAAMKADIDFTPAGGNVGTKSSSGKSASKETELYIADINKLYEAEERLKSIQEKRTDIEAQKDSSQYAQERLDYMRQIIDLYKQEQSALHDINELRRAEITGNIDKLRSVGFEVEYEAATNKLFIANQEHINALTSSTTEKTTELRKEYESLIESTHKLVDANKNNSESWRDIQKSIADMQDSMYGEWLTDRKENIAHLELTESDKRRIITAWQEVLNGIQEQIDYWTQQGLDANSDKIRALTNDFYEAKDNISRIFEEISNDAVSALDEISGAYNALKNAASEFTEYGYISLDSYKEILSYGGAYLSLLEDENGTLTINEQKIKDIISARAEQLAIESALNQIAAVRIAHENNDIATLNKLLYATINATNATWDMCYAQARLIGLSAENEQALINQISAYRTLSQTVKDGVGQMDEKLSDMLKSQQQGLENVLEYIIDMIKWEVNNQIDGLKEQITQYRKIIDLQKESLRIAKEKDGIEKTVAKKVNSIAELQSRINQLSLDDSREAQTEKKRLEQELAELQEELADYQADYAYDAQVEMLDKMADNYEESKNQEIKVLEDSISSYEKLYQLAIQRISNNWDTLYRDLTNWNYNYGNVTTDTITSAWNTASSAVQRYGSYLEAVLQTQNQLMSMSNSISSSDYSSSTSSQSSNVVGNTGNYDTSGSNTMSQIKSIVSQMKSNSSSWAASSSDAQKQQLANTNTSLASQLSVLLGRSVVRGSDGVWYLDRVGGTKLYDVYHKGGIVGGMATPKDNEVYALLEKGESVLTEEQKDTAFNYVDAGARLMEIYEKLCSSEPSLPPLIRSTVSGENYSASESYIENITNKSDNNDIDVNIGSIEAPILVTKELTEKDIRNHSKAIADIAGGAVKESFSKAGLKNTHGRTWKV